jgi:hypothetical protein
MLSIECFWMGSKVGLLLSKSTNAFNCCTPTAKKTQHDHESKNHGEGSVVGQSMPCGTEISW